MTQPAKPIDWEDIFAKANELSAITTKKPVATVSTYFEVLEQLDRARGDTYRFGGRYGASKFGGAFDLRQVCKVYMENPEVRARINELVGVI